MVTVRADTKLVCLAWQSSGIELAAIRYTMGLDPTGKVARMFGVYDEAAGMSLWGTSILGRGGTLR